MYSQDVPWLYALTVLVHAGSFAKQKVIAVATTQEELREFLPKWIARNRHEYAGRFAVDYIPFVGEVTDA